MDQLTKWLEIFQTQVANGWFGVLGWIVGMVSGVIQIKSYREQKQLEEAYKDIFEQTKRKLKGSYTEKQIRELNLELESMKRKIQEYPMSINLPPRFKQIFLGLTIITFLALVLNLVLSIIYLSPSDEVLSISNILATMFVTGVGIMIGMLAGKTLY